MALRITKAADPITVERIKMVIYAQPGIGKTSLAFTAEAPLLLDFDDGAYRAANRGDSVRVSDWRDVAGITADDLEPYQTVIMDTAGRALDVLAADIIRQNPKMGNGGALSLKGFGELKSRFAAFLKMLNGFGKDVVLIAHADEKQNGDETVERLDMQGASKNEVYKQADAMGRLAIRDGQRWLLFSPTDAAFGKNPGQLDPIRVPSPTSSEFPSFLARVIQDTKDALNAQTEAQREAAEEQAWFRETLPKVESVEGINGLIERAKAGGPVLRAMLGARAKELGFIGDKASGAYVDPRPQPEAEPEDNLPARLETAEDVGAQDEAA